MAKIEPLIKTIPSSPYLCRLQQFELDFWRDREIGCGHFNRPETASQDSEIVSYYKKLFPDWYECGVLVVKLNFGYGDGNVVNALHTARETIVNPYPGLYWRLLVFGSVSPWHGQNCCAPVMHTLHTESLTVECSLQNTARMDREATIPGGQTICRPFYYPADFVSENIPGYGSRAIPNRVSACVPVPNPRGSFLLDTRGMINSTEYNTVVILSPIELHRIMHELILDNAFDIDICRYSPSTYAPISPIAECMPNATSHAEL
ncbi:hypothetical protein WOLCODRAFT_21578 [Wolfiporia cocos MD-104 SS10]|uniref:Uncharacterized protein n=1 Tax=Wolfiporia cocos (strain MD-104) TaxID=742152 RepID=A0A2H3JDQ1_WOLCO|nr:hypothetical protein WOLCODRAFT_21578 [Wolfiporia cocos MD-104 SS10]